MPLAIFVNLKKKVKFLAIFWHSNGNFPEGQHTILAKLGPDRQPMDKKLGVLRLLDPIMALYGNHVDVRPCVDRECVMWRHGCWIYTSHTSSARRVHVGYTSHARVVVSAHCLMHVRCSRPPQCHVCRFCDRSSAAHLNCVTPDHVTPLHVIWSRDSVTRQCDVIFSPRTLCVSQWPT